MDAKPFKGTSSGLEALQSNTNGSYHKSVMGVLDMTGMYMLKTNQIFCARFCFSVKSHKLHNLPER